MRKKEKKKKLLIVHFLYHQLPLPPPQHNIFYSLKVTICLAFYLFCISLNLNSGHHLWIIPIHLKVRFSLFIIIVYFRRVIGLIFCSFLCSNHQMFMAVFHLVIFYIGDDHGLLPQVCQESKFIGPNHHTFLRPFLTCYPKSQIPVCIACEFFWWNLGRLWKIQCDCITRTLN